MEPQRAELPKEVTSALEAAGSTIEVSQASREAAATYQELLQKVNSWGRALLLLGVVQMVATGILSSSWGILLLVVGAASFYFKDAAMFMIYAMTILWAGVGNLAGGNVLWMGFAVLQFYWSVGLFRDFGRFRRVQDEYAAQVGNGSSPGAAPPMRARRIFPWASFIAGVLVLAGVVAIMVLIATASSPQVEPGDPLYILFDLLPNLAVVGMAMGLASFLSRFPYKLVAALGMLACSLVMLAWLALLFL